MANNEFFLLRHAKTEITNNLLASKWKLSEKGIVEAEELTTLKEFNDLDMIISSYEKKAYQTVKPLALRDSLSIFQFYEFNELDRDSGEFLETLEQYNQIVKQCMHEIDKSFNNWEKADHAMKRFSRKIDELDKMFENKRILIASHGIVLNLYFAKKMNQLDNVYERWKKTTYCDYGIIRDGFVVKDIAKL
jgi:2,3-bisphosphoglycerate-dependent phosphoglycerate mutase